MQSRIWFCASKYFLPCRTTTSPRSTKTPSASPTAPTTYGQASVKCAWMETLWCCPPTATASPAWRSCRSESTAEAKAGIMTALLLMKGSCWENEWRSKQFWETIKIFLQSYNFSGQNKTEISIFSICISNFWKKGSTRHLLIGMTFKWRR